MFQKGSETKNNHFVPKFYLKNFMNENKILYMRDITKGTLHEKKEKELKSVASKKNLYSLKTKITTNDISIFCQFFLSKSLNKSSSTKRYKEYNQILAVFLNNTLTDLLKITLPNDKELEKKINDFLKENSNDPTISRNQEDLFTFYEGNFQTPYNKILETGTLSTIKQNSHPQNSAMPLSSNIDHYIMLKVYYFVANALNTDNKINDPITNNPYYDLLYYIFIQYFRTNKAINACKISEDLLSKCNISQDAISFLIIHTLPMILLTNLLADDYSLTLIQNRTNISFITSDNPCINTYSNNSKECDRSLKHHEFEVYFPLSPKLAILFSKKEEYQQDTLQASEQQVKYWNKLIKHNAQRYVFSDSKDAI